MSATISLTQQDVLNAWPNRLWNTHFYGIGQKYRGKVRDNYLDPKNGQRVIISTDRLSAFDRIITAIPFKGQLLNQLSGFWFEKTRHIAPNHVVSVPDPNVTITQECTSLPIEVIARAYITGSAWRDYARGERQKSGVPLPNGLRKNEKLAETILTPSTKEDFGIHDEDISREKILADKIVDKDVYEQMEEYTLKLFGYVARHCAKNGLILVDTKVEYGLDADGRLVVIDEIFTQDSSRFWLLEPYEELFEAGDDQEQLDKEFIRQPLLKTGFKGDGEKPKLKDEEFAELMPRYVTSFEKLTGEAFQPADYATSIDGRIAANLAKEGYDTDKYAVVPIIMGSDTDMPYAEKIGVEIKKWNVNVEYHIASAHKAPKWLMPKIDALGEREDVYGIVTLAGLSNGLGPVTGAHSGLPVVTTSPTDTKTARYEHEVMSAALTPSYAPVGFVGGKPINVALQALKHIGSSMPDLRKDIKFYLDANGGRL